MDEHQLNQQSLAKAIGLSTSATRQIAIGKTKVTVPTALRLAKYFGQTPVYWLDLQRETDLAEAQNDQELQAVLKSISKAQRPAAKAKPDKKAKPTMKTVSSGKSKEADPKPASRRKK
jgi:addiction module HigA family antidote